HETSTEALPAATSIFQEPALMSSLSVLKPVPLSIASAANPPAFPCASEPGTVRASTGFASPFSPLFASAVTNAVTAALTWATSGSGVGDGRAVALDPPTEAVEPHAATTATTMHAKKSRPLIRRSTIYEFV